MTETKVGDLDPGRAAALRVGEEERAARAVERRAEWGIDRMWASITDYDNEVRDRWRDHCCERGIHRGGGGGPATAGQDCYGCGARPALPYGA